MKHENWKKNIYIFPTPAGFEPVSLGWLNSLKCWIRAEGKALIIFFPQPSKTQFFFIFVVWPCADATVPMATMYSYVLHHFLGLKKSLFYYYKMALFLTTLKTYQLQIQFLGININENRFLKRFRSVILFKESENMSNSIWLMTPLQTIVRGTLFLTFKIQYLSF